MVVKDEIKFTPLWESRYSDLVASKVAISEARNMKELALGSAYLPYSQPDPSSVDVRRLVEQCLRNTLSVLIGCDAKAHNTVWGSLDTNRRGQYLLEYLLTNNLEVANRDNEPTFVDIRIYRLGPF